MRRPELRCVLTSDLSNQFCAYKLIIIENNLFNCGKRYTTAEIEKMLLEGFDDDNFDNCCSTDSDEDEKPQLAFWNNATAESNSYEVPQWLSSINQQEQPTFVVNASNQTPIAAFSQEQNRPPIPTNFLK